MRDGFRPDRLLLCSTASTPIYKPSGCSILSLAISLATLPPFSNATAPSIAYKDVAYTTSQPDAVISFGFRGFHLVTLCMPYRCANWDRRSLPNIVLISTLLSVDSPASAGCVNGVRILWKVSVEDNPDGGACNKAI